MNSWSLRDAVRKKVFLRSGLRMGETRTSTATCLSACWDCWRASSPYSPWLAKGCFLFFLEGPKASLKLRIASIV